MSVAGRIMARRVFGKLAFFTLQDDTGIIQLYIDKGRLGDEFAKLKQWTDSGDIVGVRGTVKRTEKGEMSVYVKVGGVAWGGCVRDAVEYHACVRSLH